MNLTFLVNVAISLILIYLLLSLLASEIQELVSNLLEWRSKHLEASIRHLLGESNSSSKLTEKIYKNPLIQSLTHKAQADDLGVRKPSYIPSNAFAIALLSSLSETASDLPKDFDKITDCIKKADLPGLLKENLKIFAKEARSQTDQADEKMQKLQESIESWFDSSMESASFLYKKKSKGVTLVIGVLLSISLNINTLNIVYAASREPVLRSMLTQISDEIVTANANHIDCLEASQSQSSQPGCIALIRNDIDAFVGNFSDLPVGWDFSKSLLGQLKPWTLGHLVQIIVGWTLTSLAISMGAPFWFEVLKSFVDTRSSSKTK